MILQAIDGGGHVLGRRRRVFRFCIRSQVASDRFRRSNGHNDRCEHRFVLDRFVLYRHLQGLHRHLTHRDQNARNLVLSGASRGQVARRRRRRCQIRFSRSRRSQGGLSWRFCRDIGRMLDLDHQLDRGLFALFPTPGGGRREGRHEQRILGFTAIRVMVAINRQRLAGRHGATFKQVTRDIGAFERLTTNIVHK